VSVSATACGGNTAKNTHVLDTINVVDDIKVTSPAFTGGGAIPRANTCDGPGTEPTITWGKVPAATKAVAVVVSDPDAPSGDFLHWLVIGLPPKPGSIPSHAANVTELDNTGGTRGWTPPCPPAGSTHHYRFTVYALNDYVCADNGDASNGPDCSAPSSVQALSQIAGAAIARGVLTGTYKR
jgi:Raf kinase inhibitor-like YbhB/YbcL family protein